MDAAQQAGLTGAQAPPATDEQVQEQQQAQPEPERLEDARFTAAEDALDAGDFDLAADRYQAILNVEPANQDAQLALRQVGLLKRLSELPTDALTQAEANPDDVDAQLAAADAELAANQIDAAFARLIGLVRRVRGDDRNRIRERLVEYFELLGPDDPRVASARRDLANALF